MIFCGFQKDYCLFVGPPFCGAPVRPNMLNMPKSASSKFRGTNGFMMNAVEDLELSTDPGDKAPLQPPL